jgi:valyl-tRNA synthetase
MQVDSVYKPQEIEPHWANWWVEARLFEAPEKPSGRVFSLVIPPPNVTGSLHVGHMLEHTEIDVTIRWHRMVGDATLWLPGTDHAGIGTQYVVERKLAEEGLTRVQIGREEFERRVWAWKAESGDTIKRQMVQIGASCDWSRERFTMDPGLSRAVRAVFVRLYRKGLIYRGTYMVNWCPRCHTALSDLEVVHDEAQGNLWHIRYPIPETGEHLVVATTRPETMLGDTAVAVNPQDSRYRHLHGKTARLPLMDRDIPVIADDFADPKFGTGVVKVTPAHDPNDLEAGRRHNLPSIQVIDDLGRMTEATRQYAGLDRFEARKRVIQDLDGLGLLQKVEPYALNVGKCQRCKTVVEPLVSTQWFVKIKPLAEPAIRVVEEGRIQFIPENWSKTYFEWMYNIRDWCISRQLWWGHRIPAWHCADCGVTTVAEETPVKCEKCGSSRIEQDPDVLDTWFSSALWPFSTLGWPEQTPDLAAYYPTSLLITGFDILFFWVARMIMMGMEFMGEPPFRQVYIHGLVRDAERQKMSKTRGNVVDPLEITAKYGTDAMRMALLQGAAPGTDIVFTEERVTAARNFANKLWNAARFIFLHKEKTGATDWVPDSAEFHQPEASEESLEVALEDRWIFSRLNACAEAVNRAIETYRYHEAAQTLWHFVWHEFCDWYLEIKKPRLQAADRVDASWRNLLTVFETTLRLLHPLMPFITEELWRRVQPGSSSIAVAKYPRYEQSVADLEAEQQMNLLQEVVTAARNLRGEMKVDPKTTIQGVLHGHGAAADLLGKHVATIERLAGLKLELAAGEAPRSEVATRSAAEFDLVLRLPRTHVEAQRKRLEKEIQQLEKNISNSYRQLEDQEFVQRAPGPVVAGLRQKLVEYEAQVVKNRAALDGLIGH